MSFGPTPAICRLLGAKLTSGHGPLRQGSLVRTEARTLTARLRPSSFAFFAEARTAAADPSTFTEHMSFVFG
jgi:hypothetical protein